MKLLKQVNTPQHLEELAIGWITTACHKSELMDAFLNSNHCTMIKSLKCNDELTYEIYQVSDYGRKHAFNVPEVTIADEALIDDWAKTLVLVVSINSSGLRMIMGSMFIEPTAVVDFITCTAAISSDGLCSNNAFQRIYDSWVTEYGNLVGEYAIWTASRMEGICLNVQMTLTGHLAFFDGKYVAKYLGIELVERNIVELAATMSEWLSQFDIIRAPHQTNGIYTTDAPHESIYQNLVSRIVGGESEILKSIETSIAESKTMAKDTGVSRSFTLSVGHIEVNIIYSYYSELNQEWKIK